MKLTPELLLSAPSYINAISDRELLLRGNNIPVIENLGVTRDLNESIDLTDNNITVLGNFPQMTRLKTLLISRNRINSINSSSFAKSLPNLEMLVLSNNHLANLADLVPLSQLPNLAYLSLVDNPVTYKDYYRLWVIWQNPHIRVLDFQKVKDAERVRAKELFGTSPDQPTELAAQILGSARTRTFNVDADGSVPGATTTTTTRKEMTEKEKDALRQQLKSATSLAEISRIEQSLKSGYY
ncbi:uncharacterized protein SAPINGB_P005770 [Magnusiomyces paraingens]|uniref:U2 small nuclear ribonucleoprotein A' n=1 Tax=Magnusiomyces paraingens TaxID=2606893 RepID=A0A5E8C1M8_9ASCO|nr:uncharacterized protein SAPINGB_P005770 [Saprochaete ingens]VVT57587.1 unnamed protein product [Saprochaete ingens]